uniref:Palmdelphin n=1 Tax=Oncorhynchus tshawytscha TaxID=74940 RepID=A0A8C8GHQ5_ONCTS
MEEAELVKDRLQAITDKRKVQEDIVHKKLEIDQERLKLQHLKVQMEKEIEALEREETMISKNEGFILKRLKAIEKTPEEIIKVLGRYAMFAMEINVQKDLRTGETRVLSTSTVTPQVLQQRGVKVYDDGRKSVYALRSAESQVGDGSNRVDELSAMEVEVLLRAATEQKKSQSGPLGHQGHQESVSAFSTNCGPQIIYETNGNGYQQESYKLHNSGLEILSSSPHIPVHYFIGRQDEEYYQPNNGYNQNPFSYGVEKGFPTDDFYHSPRENPRGGMFYDSSVEMDLRPSPIYQEDSHFSILNTMDTSEPVTAIFMGYQTAEDESGRGLGYEGSIRAELVVIGDEDGVDESNPQFNTYTADGYNNRGYHHCQPQQNLFKYMAEPIANFNSNNASPYTASRNLVYPGQQAKESHYLYSGGQSDEDGTEKHSAPGIRKIKKIKKRTKPCCMLM